MLRPLTPDAHPSNGVKGAWLVPAPACVARPVYSVYCYSDLLLELTGSYSLPPGSCHLMPQGLQAIRARG